MRTSTGSLFRLYPLYSSNWTRSRHSISWGELGIPASRIWLLFDFADIKSDPTKVFARLFEQHRQASTFMIDSSTIVYENPIYEKIKLVGKTISEVNDDPIDYVAWNAQALEDGTPEQERARIRQMVAIKRLASRVTREHDDAFRLLVY
jgi:hypothetical protein